MLFLHAAVQPVRVHRSFQAVQEGLVTLCLSAELLAEVRDVLTRRKMRQRFPALTPEAVDAFITETAAMARMFDPVPSQFTWPTHPDDDHHRVRFGGGDEPASRDGYGGGNAAGGRSDRCPAGRLTPTRYGRRMSVVGDEYSIQECGEPPVDLREVLPALHEPRRVRAHSGSHAVGCSSRSRARCWFQ